MCGIFAVFGYKGDKKKFRAKVLELAKKQRHRGPDWSGTIIFGKDGSNAFAHERLAIVDPHTGNQPFVSKCTCGNGHGDHAASNVMLVANGEIFNHKKLRAEALKHEHQFISASDCEIIVHLYEEVGDDMPNYLDGDFAFVVTDGENYLAARDPIGVDPMYQGFGADGSIWFSSEMKSLSEVCERIIAFPPGCCYSSRTGEMRQWFTPSWINAELIPRTPIDYKALRESFERSVHKRLMSDAPYGVLLSGGLDSSLVAAVMSRYLKQQPMENGSPKNAVNGSMPLNSLNGCMNGMNGTNGVEVIQNGAENEVDAKRPRCNSNDKSKYDYDYRLWWRPMLHSFSIGLPGSPDLKAARHAAEFLGTVHHEFHFTIQEGLDALPDVVYHLETYDVTTIRASTPMYLMTRQIKAMGVKMVLSGEGSDEIFGGYLYFYQAPNDVEFHRETVGRVRNLHLSDCLRANKSTMAWGVEARVPFLDRDFLDVAMNIDPKEKVCDKAAGRMEKYIMRKAFDTPEDPYLPDSILWRQKEQFSDGVGYSWIDSLKEHAEKEVSDEEFAQSAQLFPADTPMTKEAFYYRRLFAERFPEDRCQPTVKRWIPRTDWGCSSDPSGRAQNVHVAAYDAKHPIKTIEQMKVMEALKVAPIENVDAVIELSKPIESIAAVAM